MIPRGAAPAGGIAPQFRYYMAKAETPNPVSQILSDAAKAKHWEHADLAMIFDVSRSAIGALLRGQTKLSAKMARDCGVVFGLDPLALLTTQNDWLLSRVRKGAPLPPLHKCPTCGRFNR